MARDEAKDTLIGLALLGLIVFIFACVGCNATYSTGTRVGTVIKFSSKGFVFKTYEGEMVLGGMRPGKNGPVANNWEFSVLDATHTEAINKAMDSGEPVKLHYRQIFKKSVLSSGTDYLITRVEFLEKENEHVR